VTHIHIAYFTVDSWHCERRWAVGPGFTDRA